MPPQTVKDRGSSYAHQASTHQNVTEEKDENDEKNELQKEKNKASIKDICNLNDKAILKSVDKNLDDDSIAKLYKIREKLYLRRIKTNW